MSKREAKGGENRSAFCGACGAKFDKSRDWQVFCSDTCRKDSWKANKFNARRIIQIEVRLSRIESQLGGAMSKPIYNEEGRRNER